MDTKVVVFNNHNARIIINPPSLDQYLGHDNVLINPDLSQVQNLAPHFWKQVGNQVIPMNADEQIASETHHDSNVTDNHVLNIQTVREVIKEIPVEVLKEVEKIVEVPVEKIVEVIKEVSIEVEKIIYRDVEVIKEKEVEILTEIKTIPKWMWSIVGLQSLIILGLMLFK